MSIGLLLACPSHAGEFLQGFTESSDRHRYLARSASSEIEQ